MDEQRLDEIEERTSKATPGPWDSNVCRQRIYLNAPDPDDDDDPVQTLAEIHSTTRDAEFCAHARTDVPDLVAEVRRLRSVNQELNALLESRNLFEDWYDQICNALELKPGHLGPDGFWYGGYDGHTGPICSDDVLPRIRELMKKEITP